jgi:hypothetical protein
VAAARIIEVAKSGSFALFLGAQSLKFSLEVILFKQLQSARSQAGQSKRRQRHYEFLTRFPSFLISHSTVLWRIMSG